eukprot:EC716843.1.p1 GENE.EC716843.1~~EC716843.1.p1  ORF type:complete len:138 (+),score=9.39 EC716843.1:64-477(+)
MRKTELIRNLFDSFAGANPFAPKRTQVTTSFIRQVVTKYFEELHTNIMNTGQGRIPGIGVFRVVHMAPRQYCDIRTRQFVAHPGFHRVKYSTSGLLKARVREAEAEPLLQPSPRKIKANVAEETSSGPADTDTSDSR